MKMSNIQKRRMQENAGFCTASIIRILSLTCAAVAAMGFLILTSMEAWSAGPNPSGVPAAPSGFEPGKKKLGNPFANPTDAPVMPTSPAAPQATAPLAPEMIEEDEFESYDDFGEPEVPAPPPGYAAPGGSQGGGRTQKTLSAGGTKDTRDVPDPVKTKKGIEVGGGKPNEITESEELAPLTVDTETGEGSKEIVTDFNFPDADILDIAKTLGKLTGKNFIYDKDVKGRITILSNAPITTADAWKAFLTSLDMNGYSLIPSGKYIRIARSRDARDKQIKTYTGDYSPTSDALITRVFTLKYIEAEEIARVFRSFMPANARIIPHHQTNTVIVTDSGANIAKLAQMLEYLDIEGYDAGIEVIAVKYASAEELAKLIDTLIPGRSTQGPNGKRISSPIGAQFAARRTKEGGVINTIIADGRTNHLIVHANAKGVEQVRELIAKLDQKVANKVAGGRLHVVYLQFADAEQVATTLNNLSGLSAANQPKQPGGGLGQNPQAAALFEGSIKVSSDKTTNSLVVTASPSDFETIRMVIEKLDIPRDEVYVEAVIMEMILEKQFGFSTNVALPTSGIASLPRGEDLASFITSPVSQKGFALGLAEGSSTTVKVNGADVAVKSVMGLIKAIQTNANANVIATPQILALDNTEATFESGTKVPVPSAVAAQGSVATGINYDDVKLSIKIKPQINKVTNFVKMDIEVKIADVIKMDLPQQVAQQAQAKSERATKTSVFVADSDTVVLGGLVRDKTDESTSKVPILGDIPLLGWLFKATDSKISKSNLLIFLTPHIIRQYEKIRALLDRKLQERDEFIQTQMGGKDTMRNYRDDMIRRLPDLKDVLNVRPETALQDSMKGNNEDTHD